MSCNLREIARRTGFSTATVSLALRDVGRISPATRAKIKAAAEALDYRPSPLLSKALSFARQSHTERYRETIALLTEYSLEDPSLDPYPAYQEQIQRGAEARARRMGYKLESFTVSGKPADHRRLGRMLHARGVRGLIVVPRVGSQQPRLHFPWQHFAAVEIGRTLWHPRNLHHVETSDYNKIIEAIHLLKKAGYRRIGMAVEPNQNKHQRGTCFAAYLLCQLRQPPPQRLPIAATTGAWSEKTVQAWVRQYRPDVLIVHHEPSMRRWLKNMGMQVPRDISLFCINAQSEQHSGLRRNYAGIGAHAVEMASLLLESGDLGLKENPRCWQVDEIWQAGTTLRLPIDPRSSRGSVP
jgi:LacI family transcriptional regulator